MFQKECPECTWLGMADHILGYLGPGENLCSRRNVLSALGTLLCDINLEFSDKVHHKKLKDVCLFF
jgi:hypothetical protein